MITIAEIEKLAQLSRIRLNNDEKKNITKDIDSILAYVDQIKKATVDIDYAPVPGVIHNVFRPDETQVISNDDRERLLNEAPDREGDYIAVKKIIAQD